MSENSIVASKENSIKLLSDGRLRHIAFIMDGNGRWAVKRGMPRRFGHAYGVSAFKRIIRYCGDIGIKYATVYAFSTENWQRPELEVESIMKLVLDNVVEAMDTVAKEKLRVIFLGDKGRFDQQLRDSLVRLEKSSEQYERTLCVALNYGGRDEIVRACNKLISSGKTILTENDVSGALFTAGIPDPDLIVRTAGEYRLSNFLMWQSAYSELYFTETLWPDMRPKDVDIAVSEFYSRKRRFGKVEG